MKNLLVVTSLLLFSGFAQAVGNVSSTVKSVRVDRNGWGMIEFTKPINTPAECHSTSYKSHFSFDTNTPGGKSIYSMALAAASSGKTITAYGTGSCSEYSNTVESMGYGHYYK